MTSPVTQAPAPTARPAAGAPGGGDSAEPFATALDGAMAGGRSDVDGTGADGEHQASDESADGAEDGAGAAPPPDLAAPPAGGLVAALWARLTGTAGAGAPPGGDGTAGRPVTTGRAHALEVAGGLAHGLRGLPPGQAPAGAAGGGPVAGVPVVPVPVPAGTGPALPASAAADAAAALAAAGVQLVVSDSETATPATTAPTTVRTTVPTTVGTAAPQPAPADPGATAGTPGAPGAPPVAGAASGVGSGSGTDGGPSDGAPDEAVPLTSTSAASAPPATAPVPRAEAATAPVAAQPVAGQLARPVAVLRAGPDGTHTMTVVLTPETLGPVEVSVTLSKGTVELTLRGAHDHGRAALIDALPELRRDLEAAGLTCSRLDVDRGSRESASSAQQQSTGRDAGGGRGQQQHREGTGAPLWHRPADNGEGHPARGRNASGLDVRV